MLKHTALVWLVTSILGTMILCGAIMMWEGGLKNEELSLVALIGSGAALVASIPAMLLYGLALLPMLMRRHPAATVKAIGSLYGIAATAMTCLIILLSFNSGHMSFENFGLAIFGLPYAIAFALAVWIIPLPDHPFELAPEAAPVDAPDLSAPPPPAYYLIAAISAVSVLYMFVSGISSGFRMPNSLFWILSFVLNAGIAIAALVLFIRWKPLGWKLMTALSAAGAAGMLISLVSTMSMLSRYGSYMYQFLFRLVAFGVLDAVALYLLARPALRLRFGQPMREYGIWIGLGIAWAIVRMVLVRTVTGM